MGASADRAGLDPIGDGSYAGAMGNMYSLHSPYFKAVYQPESFVVRTIGYLNICQYGDAYKSLSFLEKDYRNWYGKMSHYVEAKGKPADIYTTVKNYIRGKSARTKLMVCPSKCGAKWLTVKIF